jgi:(1->4)-alpha-D-glucan 1-alpha-D-glucosylmutase
VNPNADYDEAVQEFVRRVLDPERARAFRDEFLPFQRRIARSGAINTLAQTLLKIASPGVADTYQGTEIPDFSLVDPDNRRPVDYGRRQAMLNDLREAAVAPEKLPNLTQSLADSIEDGRAKLYVMWQALRARQDHRGLFAEGEYIPLSATGAKANHLFAFTRRHEGATAVVAVPRLPARLNPNPNRPVAWGDTRLALTDLKDDGPWRDAFTGRELTATDGTLAAGELFAHFPVALLIRDDG